MIADDTVDSAARTRVFVVDDHEVVRRGLCGLVDAQPDMVVVGEAATAADALDRLRAVHADVAIVDVRLPDGSGIELCREVHNDLPQTRCLVITSFDDDEALFAAVVAGAAGYVLKDVRGPNLVDAIRHVAAGRSLLDPAVTGQVLARVRGGMRGSTGIDSLNEQQQRILDLLADGLTNRQIATVLEVSEQTVKNGLSTILHRLGMQRRTQAAVFAQRLREQRAEAEGRAASNGQ